MGKKPEETARIQIDRQLKNAGWKVQDRKKINLSAGPGVAVREMNVKTGFADYLLYLDGKPLGVIEAKKKGVMLENVVQQSDNYIKGIRRRFKNLNVNPRFVYESTGEETRFRDLADPIAEQRRVFHFHTPESLLTRTEQDAPLRKSLQKIPELNTKGLRDCQIEAVTGLEKSFAQSKPRSLIQMATGSGKTYTAVTFIYRLIKFADAGRVLFLVDRGNLGNQALNEFQQYVPADSTYKFSDLYNVQQLTSNAFDPVNRVVISTIQRLYSMLKGVEMEPEDEELSSFEQEQEADPKIITYNKDFPIDTFDFIVVDECHRSIYTVWKQVLEYFDAFIIGLTATPSKQTLGFFNQNMVIAYGHEKAVADSVNVGYRVYGIRTEITKKGSSIKAGNVVEKRLKGNLETRSEALDEDLKYSGKELDDKVVAEDQIRLIFQTFRERLFTEIFPERSPEVLGDKSEVPKTLVFAKSDSHADDIVRIILDVFDKKDSPDFCRKITYQSDKPKDLLKDFKTQYSPRIAVTVDMLSTGTDIRPLECIVFMRNVRSAIYFEQMKGRGTRVVSPDDLQKVTPGKVRKTHFVIVDAVGVFDSQQTEMSSVEQKPSVPFEKLLQDVAERAYDEATLITLMGRLARLNQRIDDKDRKKISKTAGKSFNKIIRDLANATDRDLSEADKKKLTDIAVKNFDYPDLRELLIELNRKGIETDGTQIIDLLSEDRLIYSKWDKDAEERSRSVVTDFEKFIEQNKDEITALQILLNQPYGKRKVTFDQIQELAEAIDRPPFDITPERVWQAYGALDKSRVKGAGAQRLLTDLISLVRYTVGVDGDLEPFADIVEKRFQGWVRHRKFTKEQLEWLTLMKDQIAVNLSMDTDDLGYGKFKQKGGVFKFYEVFGDDYEKIMNELNEVLAA